MLRTAELALAGLTVIVMLSHSTDAERQDIKVRYYAPCVLKCSDNVTQPRDVRMFWILPDAVAIDHTTDESRLPTRLRFVNPNSSNELNITRVDDDQFGYYTCVMINASTGEVMVTQWGVNIDGADFSALEAEYRHSAIIGAIAAAVMLAVVGGGCVIWHFRFSSHNEAQRQRKDGFEDRPPAEDKSRRNQGFAGDIEVEMKAGRFGNGTTSSTTATVDGNVEADEITDHRL